MIQFLVISLIFLGIGFFLGKFSGKEIETIEEVTLKAKKRANKLPNGPINFATPRDLRYEGSERQKIDQQAAELLKQAGLK